MYELKKMERYLRVNLLGPGPRLMKKEFTGPRSHKGWETLIYSTDTSPAKVETASTVLDAAGTELRTAARKAAANCPLNIFRTPQQQQACPFLIRPYRYGVY